MMPQQTDRAPDLELHRLVASGWEMKRRRASNGPLLEYAATLAVVASRGGASAANDREREPLSFRAAQLDKHRRLPLGMRHVGYLRGERAELDGSLLDGHFAVDPWRKGQHDFEHGRCVDHLFPFATSSNHAATSQRFATTPNSSA